MTSPKPTTRMEAVWINFRRHTPVQTALLLTFALSTLASAGKLSGSSKGITNNRPHPPEIVSIFEAAPGSHYPWRENMYHALQLQDGRIICLSINRHLRQQTMQARYSTDNGRTWSAPQDLFELPQDAGGFGLFEDMLDSHGEIHIFFLCDANSGILYPKSEESTQFRPGEILDVWYVRSKDKTKSWEKPRPIWTEREVGDMLSAIQLRNGRIVLPISTASERTFENRGSGFFEFTWMGSWSRVTSIYSDDEGDTWQTSPDTLTVEAPDLTTYGADEPAIIQLKDGRVWMLMRTQRGRFYESYSPDGARWSPALPTKLFSSDSPAGLIRLKDGKILLFSNACLRHPYGYGARNVLHGAISEDEGGTWRGFREVARDPNRNEPPPPRFEDYGVAYTFPTLTTDGNVLFSNWVEYGKIRRFRLLDPAWLYETHQYTDFSNGLDDWSVFGSRGVELQPDSEQHSARVLAIRKADKEWPAGAVWNFPIGRRGDLKLALMLRAGFSGNLVGLTDQFSVPWDLEDQFYNVFDLPISSGGELLPGVKLSPNRWYNIELNWSTDQRECQVFLDRKQVGTIQDNRKSSGVNYLRLRSTSLDPDGGLLIRNVDVDVSASWKSSLH